MFKKRLLIQLPRDWDELNDREMERLSRRADRIQEFLPDLPPIHRGSSIDRGGWDEGRMTPGEEVYRFSRRRPARDRKTDLAQSIERSV